MWGFWKREDLYPLGRICPRDEWRRHCAPWDAVAEWRPQKGGGREIAMDNKDRARREREKIREFDKELFRYTGQVAWFLPGLFSFIVLVMTGIPLQAVITDRGMAATCVIMVTWVTYFVLQPYINVTDSLMQRQKKSGTWSRLKFLPVSKGAYRMVREGYLFRYLWKLALAGCIIQCAMTALDGGTVTVWNFLYVVCMLLVYPLCMGWLLLLTG